MAFFSQQQQQQQIPFRNFVPIDGQIAATQQQQQQQPIPFRNFVPIDGQIQFVPNSSFPDQSNPSFVNVMGIAQGNADVVGGGVNGWEPRRKRLKEQDLLENSQLSSIDFLQTGSVSTGLGLSLDDRRVATSSGESSRLVFPIIGEDIDREVQRMDAEMDRFIRLEGERLRQSILEKVQAKQFLTLASVEEKILRKIRSKELEVEDINKKNLELEGQLKHLTLEVNSWHERAKYNENMVNSLKYNLEHLYAQNGNNKEGCGDSELDDTASCCNGDINLQLMGKQQHKVSKEPMVCKVCRANEICMLLLPCRHLCLCKECESKLSYCPLCQTSKLIGMEIYM